MKKQYRSIEIIETMHGWRLIFMKMDSKLSFQPCGSNFLMTNLDDYELAHELSKILNWDALKIYKRNRKKK